MERELFREIKLRLRTLGRRRQSRRQRYTDATILEVYCWAAVNDRPVCWACDPAHWPKGLRRGPLPSQSDMSRRLRTASAAALFTRLTGRVLQRGRPTPLVCVIDGKALTIAGHSTDPDAGYGRATRGMGKGYKLHALIDLSGVMWGWRVTPMNVDERVIARDLLAQTPGECYLLADANYDSNALFEVAQTRGVQMVVPRRYGPGNALGHRAQAESRRRSRDLLEQGTSGFGPALLSQRRRIERYFASLTAAGGGLTCLPAWVRTLPRVRMWVQAKLILHQLRADLKARMKMGVAA